MSQETGKSLSRRLHDHRFLTTYFRGHGIDIGAGDDGFGKYSKFWPGVRSIKSWDVGDGDAQFMAGISNNSFDFVVSSHCLEHLRDPAQALANWIRILKSSGYLVITVPDEDMYEQGHWPSIFNHDHRWSFTVMKEKSWSPASINVLDFLLEFRHLLRVIKIEVLDHWFDQNLLGTDQTRGSSESAIEIICQKL